MTDNLNKYLDLLQEKRKELKISYHDLASMTGIPRTTITNTLLKYLKKSPSADVINKIAVALQMPTLVEIEQGVSSFELTPEQEELLMLYDEIGSKLGKDAQKGFVNYARFLVNGDN